MVLVASKYDIQKHFPHNIKEDISLVTTEQNWCFQHPENVNVSFIVTLEAKKLFKKSIQIS